jgi:DNA invertase Pin-like site-specific DNA recombinase
MRAVIYVRTSGLGQVDREGPLVQEDDCRRYATATGMTVVAVLHEKATTGETDDRPAYADALLMVEAGEADALLVATRSRLARNLMVQEALLRRAWDLHAEVHEADYGLIPEDDPDDPTRTFVRQMLGAVAQLDKAMTVQRLRKARQQKAARGEKAVGRYKFGQGGKDHAREAVVLADLRARLHQGQTPDTIAAALNRLGPDWRTRSGKPWTPANVTRVASTK